MDRRRKESEYKEYEDALLKAHLLLPDGKEDVEGPEDHKVSRKSRVIEHLKEHNIVKTDEDREESAAIIAYFEPLKDPGGKECHKDVVYEAIRNTGTLKAVSREGA